MSRKIGAYAGVHILVRAGEVRMKIDDYELDMPSSSAIKLGQSLVEGAIKAGPDNDDIDMPSPPVKDLLGSKKEGFEA